MSRFVIDININEGGNNNRRGIGAGAGALAGAVAGSALVGSQAGVFHWNNMKDSLIPSSEAKPYRNTGIYSKSDMKTNIELGGRLKNQGIRRFGTIRSWGVLEDFGLAETDGSNAYSETAFGQFTRATKDRVIATKNSIVANKDMVIKGGVALAWRASSETLNTISYTSGNQTTANKNQLLQKGASYGSLLLATGFNPLAIAGIVANEAISITGQAIRYGYDRKIENGAIQASTVLLGDLSYGRNRR